MHVRVVWTAEIKPDFVSRCIMWAQRRPYSHIGIVFDDQIVHAVGKGVCIEPVWPYLKQRKIVMEKEVSLHCSRDRFLGFIEGESGKEYSNWQLVAIALGVPWFPNGDKKRICSEFVANVLLKFGNVGRIPESFDYLDYVTPKCIENFLQPRSVE